MTEITASVAAWWNFQTRVESLGGVVLEHEWLGNSTPHRVRCLNGHDCAPRPNSVRQGQGICRACAGKDSKTSETKFRKRIAGLGGAVLEPVWLGSNKPHRVVCAAGHCVTARPTHVIGGRGICRTCAGNDPEVAETAFRRRVTDLGGVVVEQAWLGALRKHRVRCGAGHDCAPRPNDVRTGQGICAECRGKSPDTFYVVSGIDEVTGIPAVKPGIASNGGRNRVSQHASIGLTDVHGMWADLARGVARQREQLLLSHLAAAGWGPTRGNEYFPIAALTDVLTFCHDTFGCTVGDADSEPTGPVARDDHA